MSRKSTTSNDTSWRATAIIRSRSASSTGAPSGRALRGSARTASRYSRLEGRSDYSQSVASIWKVRPWKRSGRDSSCPWECPDRSPPGCWCCSDRFGCGTSPETQISVQLRLINIISWETENIRAAGEMKMEWKRPRGRWSGIALEEDGVEAP